MTAALKSKWLFHLTLEEKNFPNGEDLDTGDLTEPLLESEVKALKACKGDDKDALIELGVETFLAFFEAEVGGGAFSSSDILAVFSASKILKI